MRGARKNTASVTPHRRTGQRPPVPRVANKLVELLALLMGKRVVATVASGARYEGIAENLSLASGNGQLSVALRRPKALGTPEALPEVFVILGGDLVEVEVVEPLDLERGRGKLDREKVGVEKEKLDKSDKTDKVDKAERPIAEKAEKEKTEKDKPEKEKPAWVDKLKPKTVKTERIEKAEKAEVKAERDKPEKTEKADKPEKVEKADKSEKVEKVEKPEKPKTWAERVETSFKTDASIAAGAGLPRERELQRWVPDADTPAITLEDLGGHWDQFSVNREKFGVESTYDEHLYTTRIDTGAADYQQRLERADRLAREIEGLALTNAHVLEERNRAVPSHLTEEDRFSGVRGDEEGAGQRDTRGHELMAALQGRLKEASPVPAPGKYATPKQRAAQYHNDPAIVLSLATDKGEAFRLNAQSEINALKEFSATFKVPHKMPHDLLPILGKEKPVLAPAEKKEKERFKLNPKAAAFTPARPLLVLPNPPRAPYKLPNAFKLPSTHLPRAQQKAYSGAKRHFQVSAQDFFGGADKVPTKESQRAKVEQFKLLFNMFRQEPFEKAFQCAPIWDSTLEELFHTLFLAQSAAPKLVPMPQYLGKMMAPMAQGFQPGMMYQFPGQPMMYPEQFVPPFAVPGFASPTSPVLGNTPYMTGFQGNYPRRYKR